MADIKAKSFNFGGSDRYIIPQDFIINVTEGSEGNFTADKTYAEILEAYNMGHTLYVVVESYRLPLIGFSSVPKESFMFVLTSPGMMVEVFIANDAIDASIHFLESVPAASTSDAGKVLMVNDGGIAAWDINSTNILKAVTTAGDGSAYTVPIPGITELTAGLSIFVTPHVTSTAVSPTLNVNGLGAVPIKRRLSDGMDSVADGAVTTLFYANRAVKLTYSVVGSTGYWLADDYPKPDAADLYGSVPIANGGTGATTAAAALRNLGITYGTSDLTAGTSELATGAVYFVYEE